MKQVINPRTEITIDSSNANSNCLIAVMKDVKIGIVLHLTDIDAETFQIMWSDGQKTSVYPNLESLVHNWTNQHVKIYQI